MAMMANMVSIWFNPTKTYGEDEFFNAAVL
jgi:hypothetical protein